MMKALRNLTLALLLSPAWLFAQQVENGGFESWENAGTVIDEPTEWSSIKTSDNPITNDAAPVVWGRVTDDVHSGESALKLMNVAAFSIVATGTMVNGRIHADFNPSLAYCYTDQEDARWHTVLTQRPDSVVGWFKFYPKGNDILQVKAVLHIDAGSLPENGTEPNWVALAAFESTNATYDEWTRFSAPFIYFGDPHPEIPEFILLNLTSGNGTNAIDSSWALYDDIQLIYDPAGIHEQSSAEDFLHISGDRVVIDLTDPKDYTGYWFHIIDITGRSVFDEQLTGPVTSPLPGNLSPGVYVAILNNPRGIFVQKIYLD